MARTTLYLVRHGEQEPDGENLSPRGREQARQLGHRLAGIPFDAIHCSSLPRAAQSAAIVAEHLPGVPAHPCEWAKDRTPIIETYPERYQAFFEQVPPEERDPGAVRLREAVTALSRTADHARHPAADERTDLVVTHNFVIGWFVRHVLEAPDWRWLGLNQANGGLTVLQWETGRPAALLSFNDVGHL
ncbi:histidine phosphatase family protein [Kineosporia babensis]|uniref:Histidine phosphatase family protein n=1 Tax=Kineosporia babensis TaxID=499548 RepID=A0A9X1NIY3_9ACTN|nr:histidine phosphatase family protein [Kineosporia babensis]MCD5315887.1 histidine phosphatase family protein [Kineosporia babensis]